MTEQKASRILVIDDEVTQRMLVKEYLEEAGYQVRLAEDGRHGLKMAATLNVDLIILDVMLPSLDGYTVCSCLRQQPKTEHVPIILITGSKEADAFSKGLAAGATDFITKPVEWQFLADRVAHVLEQSKHFRRMEEELRAASHDRDPAEFEQSSFEDQIEATKAEWDAELARTKAELEERCRVTEFEAEIKVAAAASEIEELKELHEQTRATQQAQIEALEAGLEDKLRAVREGACDEQLLATASNVELARVKDELAQSRSALWRFCQVLGQQHLGQIGTLLQALETGRAQPEKALAVAQELAAAVHRLRVLANHMVDGAQINEKLVDVDALIRSAMSAMDPQCRQRGVSIETTTASGARIFGDELRLEFLLLNLLSNAVRFSVAGSVVRIEPQVRPDGSLRIAVRDCGIGIAPAVLQKLQSALEAPTNMLTRQGDQIGFGIPIATAVAKLHGGRLEFGSALGQGTSAAVVLPCERVSVASETVEECDFERARLG